MSVTQPSLLDAPTLDEAIAIGERQMAEAHEKANREWIEAAETMIRGRKPGETFIAEDIVISLTDLGYATSNAKAIGSIVKAMSRKGVIEPTGRTRRARTSNGSQKPIWRRVGSGEIRMDRAAWDAYLGIRR